MQLRPRVASSKARTSSDCSSIIQRQYSSNLRKRSALPCSIMTAKKRCLLGGDEEAEEAKRWRFRLLQSAFGPEDRVEESNWLTGSLIDLMLWKFANLYPTLHFLPTAFYHLHLEAMNVMSSPWRHRRQAHRSTREYHVYDVLGRVVDYESEAPLVFIVNVDRIHWNLFRVQLQPTPELQLFEPTGRLALRSGISYRSVPRTVIEWLDVCYPQHKGWLNRTVSAITNKQQSVDEINKQIDQSAITSFRKQLQIQLRTTVDEIDA